jgi:hypothetical protein
MATGPVPDDDRTSEIAIFARRLKADHGDRSREPARYIVILGSDEPDQARMRDLAERIQQRGLAPNEGEELQSDVKARTDLSARRPGPEGGSAWCEPEDRPGCYGTAPRL